MEHSEDDVEYIVLEENVIYNGRSYYFGDEYINGVYNGSRFIPMDYIADESYCSDLYIV